MTLNTIWYTQRNLYKLEEKTDIGENHQVLYKMKDLLSLQKNEKCIFYIYVYKIYVWTFRNADRNEKRNKKLKGIAVGDKQKQIQL